MFIAHSSAFFFFASTIAFFYTRGIAIIFPQDIVDPPAESLASHQHGIIYPPRRQNAGATIPLHNPLEASYWGLDMREETGRYFRLAS